jgi:hypothetical protein
VEGLPDDREARIREAVRNIKRTLFYDTADQMPPRERIRHILLDLLTERDGAFVPCPKCGGEGLGPPQPDGMRDVRSVCSECYGEKRIRRELAALLELAEVVGVSDDYDGFIDHEEIELYAREKWGELFGEANESR